MSHLRGEAGQKTAIFIKETGFVFLVVSATLISPISHMMKSEPEMIGKSIINSVKALEVARKGTDMTHFQARDASNRGVARHWAHARW